MKKLIVLTNLLLITFCFGQQKGAIILNWSNKLDYSIGETKMYVPQFDIENFNFDSYNKVLLYAKTIPQQQPADEKSIEITNAIFEIIPENLLGDLDRTKIPSKIEVKLASNYARNDVIATLEVTPIINEGGLYKRLKSFSYSFNNKPEVSNRNSNSIYNSVLAYGDWYRFYIEKSGVYKISKSFLSQLGLKPETINPKKIQLFGNGGRMLPLLNGTYYPEDLTENAIQIIGENDGVFNESDYILFYGEGVDNWNSDSETNGNLYVDKSYYYITISGNDGKRIPENSQPSSAATQIISEFDDTQFHEIDKVNIIKLGRTWFGEEFNTKNIQDFSFNIPNLVPTSNIIVTTHCAALSTNISSFKIDANGQLFTNINFTGANLPDHDYFTNTIPATENLTFKYTYNNNGVPVANGYLDYINLKFKRLLKGYGKQFRFQNNATANSSIKEYQVSDATNIGQVWDITDIYNVSKYSNAQSNFSFKTDSAMLRKYIAVDKGDFLTPLKDSNSKVANQNIKGNIFKNDQEQIQDIDYLIITPAEFYNEAEKLANFHRNYSQLNTKVVTVESIYPEFSSGNQDVAAIRNMIRYVYNNAPNTARKVKYVNLFGDASYDYKKRISKFSNFVPIYQALNSYVISESSFASDDFFGLMDANEGNLDVSEGILDIAVGRMIANNSTQADELVNKIIEYHDYKSYGNWRNNFTVIADDADAESDISLQEIINSMADTVVTNKPFVNVKKILMDSYVQESAAGGQRYPQARKDMFNAFETGSLVFNYLGHGGEDGLAQERIWEKIDGQSLNNRYKYPLFITITCDFSRFDNPMRETAGEFTYWNPKGGAIGMITTVREIGQGTGEGFNIPLAKYIFGYNTTTNESVSIAESFRLAKNNYSSPTRIVAFLGDPALVLALPKPKVRLTKVNDIPVSGITDDFKALALMKLDGEVTDENGQFIPTYNGEVAIQIFDKSIVRTTLNNDGNARKNLVTNAIILLNFTNLGETIFRGNATVVNGKFELSFVVPRDISIPVGNGKVSFYSKRKTILLDKTGVDTTIKIGGVNLNAPADNLAPTVKLYMNDQTFVNGGNTNQSPIFLAFLEDENGINTASGIGHDIVAILDGDETKPYKLNEYYETELDNYKKGKLKFPFRNLALGLHSITFKAFDVYNNPVVAEIQFVVVGNDTITLTNVLNYPNPCVNYTQFWFTHNRPFEPLEVQVQIMTVTGKVIWTKNQIVATEGFLSREITWDGRDDFGDKIGKGVYIYKLTVKSNITNSKTEKYEKLVIL